jgi:hypothetical protein
LDMQRRLVDMEAGRMAADGALKGAATLQLRVAALEKELAISRYKASHTVCLEHFCDMTRVFL